MTKFDNLWFVESEHIHTFCCVYNVLGICKHLRCLFGSSLLLLFNFFIVAHVHTLFH